MSVAVVPLLSACGTVLAGVGVGYAVTALAAVRLRRSVEPPRPPALPPATVLKPLCGAEPELYDCLKSFCEQQYPGTFQIVFGVRDPVDPAVAVVRRLQGEFPELDLQIAIDPTQHGTSAKVSNLINMMSLVKHDCLVLADSDVRVPPGYLASVVAPLLDRGVGIVTCPYRGLPRAGFWSLLGSLFINDWFMPSVSVAALFGSRAFAFGASISLRRDALAAIGGFAAIVNQLADDYRLGELTRRLGLRTVLSNVVVETWVDERSYADLVRHELRWLRTIRAVRPSGYAMSFVTFSLPLAMLGTLLAGGGAVQLTLLGGTALVRLMLHFAAAKPGPLRQLWALPIADALAFALWCWGFAARRVQWRHAVYIVARDGSVHPVP